MEQGTTKDEMAGWLTDSTDVSVSELRELVMDWEAWRAVIHGVTKSQTRLKQLSSSSSSMNLNPFEKRVYVVYAELRLAWNTWFFMTM